MYDDDRHISDVIDKAYLHEKANDTTRAANVSCGAAIGTQYGMECRASLAERVSNQARNAARESDRLHRLRELEMLLAKNPEVARILDLMEEVRG